ncbi:DNA photolyase [Aureococcus anophagefferens]|nr:DNA photolyase [Aureococcus anophagefferens]
MPSARAAALLLAAAVARASTPIAFVKLHRVGGTTLQNLLVRHAVNRNRTVLCTHLVASFNPRSLTELDVKARGGEPPSNTGAWPLDIWLHHVAFIRELERAVPLAKARILTVVRAPERRFESAWAVFTSRAVVQGRAEGWGMGVYGLTPGDYCGNVSADRQLLALERVRRSTHVSLDGMTRALVGLTHQDRREPKPKRLEELVESVRKGSVFAVVNERYDESLLWLARDYGFDGGDIVHGVYQRRVKQDSWKVVGDTRHRSKDRDALPSSLDDGAAACLRATQPNDVALADPQCSLLERAVAALNQKVPLPRHHQEAFSGRLCPSPKRPRGAVAPDERYAPAFRDGAARAAVADLDAALAAAPGRDVSASAACAGSAGAEKPGPPPAARGLSPPRTWNSTPIDRTPAPSAMGRVQHAWDEVGGGSARATRSTTTPARSKRRGARRPQPPVDDRVAVAVAGGAIDDDAAFFFGDAAPVRGPRRSSAASLRVVWFRVGDLRLDDQDALAAACEEPDACVVPVFVLGPDGEDGGWPVSKALDRGDGKRAPRSLSTFLRRFAWRDLAYWSLWYFPTLCDAPLRPQYEKQAWADAAAACDAGDACSKLRAWQLGLTGFPLVDAAMRQLWAWFHDTLVDADAAINAFMWQNGGRSGMDQWNFVMHPVHAAKNCDPEGDYLVHCGADRPRAHAALGLRPDGTGCYPHRVIRNLDRARQVAHDAVLAVRASPEGRKFVLSDGSEALPLRCGRTVRLITRVDFREDSKKPVTVQVPDESRDPKRRAPEDTMGRLLWDEQRAQAVE